MSGYGRTKRAVAGMKGFEAMRAGHKGKAAASNITHDTRGEACIVERAFGFEASALAEAVQFASERLELEAA